MNEHRSSSPAPIGAVVPPPEAKVQYQGELLEVLTWDQVMLDGSEARFEMARRPDTASVVLVLDDKIGTVAVTQPGRDEVFLDFPGGRVDDFESPCKAAMRELREECALEVEHWRLLEVAQPSEKIDYFVYTYLAFGESHYSTGSLPKDPGEAAHLTLLSMSELNAAATSHPRLRRFVLSGVQSVAELLSLPGVE